MNQENNFTEGKILSPLIRFMVPVFLAMFLQAMYGAVDLLIVGRFAQPVDVSAVSTGSQIMMTITNLVTSLAMGTTILLGQRIGEGRSRAADLLMVDFPFFGGGRIRPKPNPGIFPCQSSVYAPLLAL